MGISRVAIHAVSSNSALTVTLRTKRVGTTCNVTCTDCPLFRGSSFAFADATADHTFCT